MQAIFDFIQCFWPLLCGVVFILAICWAVKLLAQSTRRYECDLDLEMQHSSLYSGPIFDAEPRRHPLRPRAPSSPVDPPKASIGPVRLERMTGTASLKLPQ